MGAVLDTPSLCPLCNELVGDPVILKCNHRYCRRCIGDLWSITPSGPFKCPEWRCTTIYNTLPFGTTGATGSRASGQGPPPGTSSNRNNYAVNSKWSKPSFTNFSLGKRKASVPEDHRPDTKRPAVAPPHAAAPSNDQTAPSPVQFSRGESLPSADDDRRSSTHSMEYVEVASEVPTPGPEPEEVLEDSRSSSEEDTFVPAPAAPTPDLGGTQTTSLSRGTPASPDPSPSPAPSPSPSRTEQPSPCRVGWASPHFPLRPKLTATRRLSPGPPSPHRSPQAPPPTASPAPVPCHYCAGAAPQPAVKTCLVCGASMCAEHLRPHLDSPVFRSHTLVPPIDDLSPWRCPEHQEMSRIYCRQCAVCVCTVCTVIGSHRDHACVSIREAERELRGNLKEEIQQLQESENTLIKQLDELRQKKLDFEGVLEEARVAVQQQYAAMREALEQEEQSALQCVVQEEARSVGGLEGRLSRLRSSLVCVQQGLHTLEGLADAKGEQRVQEQAFIMEYSKITQMFSEAGPGVVDLDSPGEEVDRARLQCLKSWTEKRLNALVISLPERDPYRLLYGTVPSLDADTAHPKLLLSDDYRQVTYGEVQRACAEQGARFSSFPQVLASEAMEQGRWYWEVEVASEDAGQWKVGVSEAQIGRKGQKGNCRLGFNPFSWCLGAERGKVEAMHDRASVSVAAGQLQRIGVFLDCDEGVLSFLSVTPGGALALLHTFKQQFAGPLYPAFSVCKAQLTICDLFEMSDTE